MKRTGLIFFGFLSVAAACAPPRPTIQAAGLPVPQPVPSGWVGPVGFHIQGAVRMAGLSWSGAVVTMYALSDGRPVASGVIRDGAFSLSLARELPMGLVELRQSDQVLFALVRTDETVTVDLATTTISKLLASKLAELVASPARLDDAWGVVQGLTKRLSQELAGDILYVPLLQARDRAAVTPTEAAIEALADEVMRGSRLRPAIQDLLKAIHQQAVTKGDAETERAWSRLLGNQSPDAGRSGGGRRSSGGAVPVPTPTPTPSPTPTPTPTPTPSVPALLYVSTCEGNPEIYGVQTDGTGRFNLSQNAGDDLTPSWSPDGSQVAFATNRDGNWEIYVMNADGTGAVNVTQHASDDTAPAWSPDGSRIAFVSERDGNQEIYVMDPDGANLLNLTQHALADSNPVWSPDSTEVAFVSQRDGNSEVYVVGALGIGLLNVSQHPGTDDSPSWKPASSRLAFVSDRDGDRNIYRVEHDGSSLTAMTSDTGSDEFPLWHPGGGLFFVTDRNGNQDIYRRTAGIDSLWLDLTGNDSRFALDTTGALGAIVSDATGFLTVHVDLGSGVIKLVSQAGCDSWQPVWRP